jgi:hypothetical protein
VITTILNRLGNLGLLLIACALLLGGLAGAAVAHHYDRLAADTTATQPNDKGDGAPKLKPLHGNGKHLNHGHQGRATATDQAETD